MAKSLQNDPIVAQILPRTPSGLCCFFYELPQDFPVTLISGECYGPEIPIVQLHVHDSLEIGLCHSGSGIFIVGDRVFSYGAGDVVVIRGHVPHECRNRAGHPIHHTFMWMDPARLVGPVTEEADLLRAGRLGGSEFPNILPRAQHPRIAATVLDIIEELQGQAPGYRSAVRSLTWTLMTLLSRLPGVGEQEADEPPHTDLARIAPALSHLAANLADPLDVPSLADMCHLSVTHFFRVFKAAVGKSPLEYLMHLRIRMATSLLEGTDKPIIQVAADVGYPALSSFNRNFRAVTGVAPRGWRRKHSGQRRG